MNTYRKICICFFTLFFLIGCNNKNYHHEMINNMKKTINKKNYDNIKKSYTETFVNEKVVKKSFVSILTDKSLSEVLKELELLDGNYYFLKSSDILIPRSRIKIHNVKELNEYLSAVIDKELYIKKTGSISLVKLLSKSETKRQSIDQIMFKLDGEISVEELIKLITAETGYEVSIGNYINDIQKFQNSIISIKAKNIFDALNSLAHAKNVYVDIDYDKEMINIKRYKDLVIELNIPILDLQTSTETSTEKSSGESKIKNNSKIVLYDELDKMLKNIISTDKISTYHIDKSSGLIFLKSTKDVENALRIVVKAYEESFAKETTIEFERIELVLNKNRKYGIGSVLDDRQGNKGLGVRRSLESGGGISFVSDNLTRLLKVTATVNNKIGKILNYNKNVIVLKNNIPSVQSISQNTDYIEKIETTVNDNVTTSEATVNTIKDGTSISAMAKISRDKIFLNITPNIKKLIKITEANIGKAVIQLPEYKDQSYNISREVNLGETAILGSIISHDDAKEYEGILPLEGFAIGGNDSKSYVRREIIYVVTVRSIKGF